MEPRVPLLTLDELDDEARSAFDDFMTSFGGPRVVNAETSLTGHAQVLLYNPEVFRGLNASGELIRTSDGIEARDRELMMMRTAWVCQAAVVWSNHSGHAHGLGFTADDLDRIAQGPDADGWTPREAALLRMVDELLSSATVTDETWAVLAEHYDVEQLVAFPMQVGTGLRMCYLFNSLGVPPPDPTRGGLAAR